MKNDVEMYNIYVKMRLFTYLTYVNRYLLQRISKKLCTLPGTSFVL